MTTKEILEQALKLKPAERFMLLEGLIKSLDEPDKKLDDIMDRRGRKKAQSI